ncbi:hypothetical protein KAFR_0A01800 [Kazachstania africana CBS 2517]|uniref:TLC domain-containing protein n=1 Tax=Kazachstania africana (strain ATCC 22294 / BCRC 22015 / CBS 2517 / CECT 1963 / NBRC 1671 / NRRL Y-8276) TaxID=1071382 RepID=H2AML8_KAZAF|nr:hypothetical protein KAFR_0A01800 [Kazachstania africana CBS 2517]CCF55618.1 hypothetical protein KAFR_0A01800 [Kazachstania africana CBS 2517]
MPFDIEAPTFHEQPCPPSFKTGVRRPRSSSLGKINLGDAVPGLTGISGSKQAKLDAKQWHRILSTPSKSNFALLEKFFVSFWEVSSRHLWIMPLLIIAFTYLVYLLWGNRSESNPLHMFVAISYQVGDTNMYGKGAKDLCFISFYMIFFTFLREFIMDVIIRPAVIKLHITSKHKLKRIMEQTFYIIYYGIAGPFGLYIMYGTDLWLFRTTTMYKTYPDFNISHLLKIFYLGQAAFWTQQACVLLLQLEKPRKDFKELCFHHAVTLLLIWLSYTFHFTKMGLPIYITMDISDFFLALSKTLNYLDSKHTPTAFIVFIFSWIYLRHYVNIKILWSVLTEFRTEGNFILNFGTSQYKCWISQTITFTLLMALQLVNLYWLVLILRILYRFIFKGVQADERSDSTSEESSIPPLDEHLKKKISSVTKNSNIGMLFMYRKCDITVKLSSRFYIYTIVLPQTSS